MMKKYYESSELKDSDKAFLTYIRYKRICMMKKYYESSELKDSDQAFHTYIRYRENLYDEKILRVERIKGF